MVNRCCVPGCPASKSNISGVTFHRFPSDPVLLGAWLEHFPKTNFAPSAHSRVCSLHFSENDFTCKSQDKQESKRRQQNHLLTRRLVPQAVPTFQPIPEKGPLEDVSFSTYLELALSVDNIPLPDGTIVVDAETQYCFIELSTNITGAIEVVYSLQVEDDLEFNMYVRGVKVAKTCVRHILKGQGLHSTLMVSAILHFLKGLAQLEDPDEAAKMFVRGCGTTLRDLAVSDTNLAKKLAFLSEQLELSVLPKMGRKYSQELLTAALIWKTTSPALYGRLVEEEILSLPSIRNLQYLSSCFGTDVNLTEETKAYLRARFHKLCERERLVEIMIDEINIQQKLEFSHGKLHGWNDGNLCKTLLSFMIQSIAGSHEDVVALYPLSKISSEIIKKNFDAILACLCDIGYTVVVVSVDNAAANRKFYVYALCNGELRSSIPNPHRPGEVIFLLFDSVHNFKNLRNNFNNRKVLLFPDFDCFDKILTAKYKHVEDLYAFELTKPVKLAHKLSHKVLHPSTIEKTNVQLADSFFHESTINALIFYAKEQLPDGPSTDGWLETSKFMQLVRQHWNIVNVKSCLLGQKKLNVWQKPIKGVDSESVQFLLKFASWLRRWQSMRDRSHSLTRETFTALIQTTSTIP